MSFRLLKSAQGIALSLENHNHPYQVDFTQGPLRWRFDHLQGRNELIAKAIGWRKGATLHIFDTTAGIGREAFLLAALGCRVTLFERHETIATLLKDGLQRGAVDPHIAPIIENMTLIESCAIQYLKTQNIIDAPDVIYCDPMFEARTKSAAVKKEMQVLQTVVGPDLDAQELVHLSLQRAKKRVVVKRNLNVPPLKENPQLTFIARSHRFDVYLLEGKNHAFL